MTDFFDVIKQEIAKLNLPKACEVWAEPGRALVGHQHRLWSCGLSCARAIVLYINDGSFGNMFEVCSMGWKNNAR